MYSVFDHVTLDLGMAGAATNKVGEPASATKLLRAAFQSRS